jgi:hypothetical protein
MWAGSRRRRGSRPWYCPHLVPAIDSISDASNIGNLRDASEQRYQAERWQAPRGFSETTGRPNPEPSRNLARPGGEVEQHLRHILKCYMEYYNAVRTHLSLGKDAPIWRDIQCAGRIEVRPVLGGLHQIDDNPKNYSAPDWLDPPGMPGPHRGAEILVLRQQIIVLRRGNFKGEIIVGKDLMVVKNPLHSQLQAGSST